MGLWLHRQRKSIWHHGNVQGRGMFNLHHVESQTLTLFITLCWVTLNEILRFLGGFRIGNTSNHSAQLNQINNKVLVALRHFAAGLKVIVFATIVTKRLLKGIRYSTMNTCIILCNPTQWHRNKYSLCEAYNVPFVLTVSLKCWQIKP